MRTSSLVLGWLVAVFIPSFFVEAKLRADDYDDYSAEVGNSKGNPATPARRGKFPNVGALLFDGRHICGCTLVSNTHVLTAANCVSFLKNHDSPKLSVYLNTVALKTYNPGAVIHKVLKFKIHENYNKQQQVNDIALLTLDSSVATLYPLSLPADGTKDDFVGKNATILRWGLGKEGSTSQKILLQASVSVISNTQCGQKYKSNIADNSLCAFTGFEGETSCQDDSTGGPVIVDGRQVGIMSWGKGCMDSFYPGVYTRITAFLDWIKLNTAV